jgi:dUTP pyrophosphatase
MDLSKMTTAPRDIPVAEDSPRSPIFASQEFDDDDYDFIRRSKTTTKMGVIRSDDEEDCPPRHRTDEDPEDLREFVKIMIDAPGKDLPLKRFTSGSVGYDVYAPKKIALPPMCAVAVGLGFYMMPPEGHYGQFMSKSRLALNGIITVGGVIDPDYRGEVAVILFNLTSTVKTLEKDEAISQLIFLKMKTPAIRLFRVSDHPTERGARGCLDSSIATMRRIERIQNKTAMAPPESPKPPVPDERASADDGDRGKTTTEKMNVDK